MKNIIRDDWRLFRYEKHLNYFGVEARGYIHHLNNYSIATAEISRRLVLDCSRSVKIIALTGGRSLSSMRTIPFRIGERPLRPSQTGFYPGFLSNIDCCISSLKLSLKEHNDGSNNWHWGLHKEVVTGIVLDATRKRP